MKLSGLNFFADTCAFINSHPNHAQVFLSIDSEQPMEHRFGALCKLAYAITTLRYFDLKRMPTVEDGELANTEWPTLGLRTPPLWKIPLKTEPST